MRKSWLLIGQTTVCALAANARAQCEPKWSGEFSIFSPHGQVNAFAQFDDGRGPALFVGGDFELQINEYGDVTHNLAIWRDQWEALPQKPPGPVTCMTVFDDDGPGPHPPALYAGGITSDYIDGYVARWDGAKWIIIANHFAGDIYYYDAPVKAVIGFDGGEADTPQLYVAGHFQGIGDTAANGVAAWNGHTWSALGSGLCWSDWRLCRAAVGRALAIADDLSTDGPGTNRPGRHGRALYVGGAFDQAGGVSTNNIARWDGQSWSALGVGISGGDGVYSLLQFEGARIGSRSPDLYVGGSFTRAGGDPAYSIAEWNGTTWSALGGGLYTYHTHELAYARVSSMLSYAPGGPGHNRAELYAAGTIDFATDSAPFDFHNAVRVGNVARWDGSHWKAVGTAGIAKVAPAGQIRTPPDVRALSLLDLHLDRPELYLGGSFNRADGAIAQGIVRWDGHAVHPLANGLDTPEYSSQQQVNALAVSPQTDSVVQPDVYAGGYFSVDGDDEHAGLAKWDGNAWHLIGRVGAQTMAFFDDDGPGPHPASLYVAGLVRGGVQRLEGDHLVELREGLPGLILSMAAYDPDGDGPAPAELYAGGYAEGTSFHGIARWNGTAWADGGLRAVLAPEHEPGVWWMAVLDGNERDAAPPALFIGGGFRFAGTDGFQGVLQWDGHVWSKVGPGISGFVGALAVLDDGNGKALYAGGRLDTSGSPYSVSVAKWDGANWSPVGGAIEGWINAMVMYEDEGPGPGRRVLLAGGGFVDPRTHESVGILKWDGRAWTPFGGGVESAVYALAVLEGNPSRQIPSALFVGGRFDSAGGVPSFNIARWGRPCWAPNRAAKGL